MSETRTKRKIEFIESYWTGGELGSDYKWDDNHGELVRCGDCKHFNNHPMEHGLHYGECDNGIGMVNHDWFCAAGEREEKE